MQRKQRIYSSAADQLRESRSLQLQYKKAQHKLNNSPYKQKYFSRSKAIQSQISTNPTKSNLKRMSNGNFRLKMYNTPINKQINPSRLQNQSDVIDADEVNRRFIKKQIFIFQNEELELGYHDNKKVIKKSKYSKRQI